jgi:calcium-translocating P-type ATPase
VPSQPPDWHAASQERVLAHLDATASGLTSAQAAERLARAGANQLPQSAGPSASALLVGQLRTPLMGALIAAGVAALALGELEDGIVVLAVVTLNALIGFFQEYRAGRAIAALSHMVAEPATVRRDGVWTRIPADRLVPGDIVEVAQGDRVAADLRLLGASALRAQEAALTGESEPVDKAPDPVVAGAPLAERRSMLFAGTLVAAGSGHGVAVATGPGTELGHVSALLESVDPLQTPLTRGLDRFGRVVTAAIAAATLLLAVVALVRGFTVADATMAAVGIAVAAVPEGLPAVVTIALAVGVQRMARRRAIIRHLPAVETLGSTTVIASDKTGTLTRNEMRVRAVVAAPGSDEAAVLRAGVLCNDARVAADGSLLGDPTETALLRAAAEAGLDVQAERDGAARLATLPFDASTKLMATVHARPGDGAELTVKGAPEAVLPRCREGDAAWIRDAVRERTGQGERVLVLARGAVADPADVADALADLELLGLQTMIDPLRPGAVDAVAACREAGIRVAMITGDHPRTARAIGASLGLADRPAVTGADLDGHDDASLERLVGERDIYARVEPAHKLRLVRALQRRRAVVAMTGDGVNDAPALRQADIGVAMGRGGTAAAKEAADMVLADDDISTLRAAVEEGRRVYDNLVKALAFVLPTSLGQALIIAVAVLAFPTVGGEPLLPVSPVQILWINLIVAVALALPLALEAPEPDLMRRPPRDAGAALLDRALAIRTVLVAVTLTAVALVLFGLERRHQLAAGADPDVALARAQTTAVTGAVLLQALYLVACRSLTRPNRELGWWSNPWVYAGIATVLGLQALFVAAPFMHTVFGSTSLDARELAWAALAATAVVPVTSLEERWRRAELSAERRGGLRTRFRTGNG